MKIAYSGFLSILMMFLAISAFPQETEFNSSVKQKALDEFLAQDQKVEVKLNSLALIGIVNPAFEIRIAPEITIQTEALCSFYFTNFLGTGKPFALGSLFVEGRYYTRNAFHGFYLGPVIGGGVFKMNKSIYPMYSGYEGSYQHGCNVMAGLSLGYHILLSHHWSMDLNIAGGYQHTTYQGYKKIKPEDPYEEYVGVNYSAEWLPMFKGGIYIGYRL